jgi:DNA-binding HxlR family transcriptional regulator
MRRFERVEYELTTLGRSIVAPLAAIRGWAGQHIDGVLAARQISKRPR